MLYFENRLLVCDIFLAFEMFLTEHFEANIFFLYQDQMSSPRLLVGAACATVPVDWVGRAVYWSAYVTGLATFA